jgi:hypothetical protein
MTTWGADAGQLDALAAAFDRAANVLDQNRVRLNAQVHHAPWKGSSAERFRRDWDSVHLPHLVSAASFLHTGRAALARNAADQQHASASVSRPAPWALTPSHPPSAGSITKSAGFILGSLGGGIAGGVPKLLRLGSSQTAIDTVHAGSEKLLRIHGWDKLVNRVNGVAHVVDAARFAQTFDKVIRHPTWENAQEADDAFVRGIAGFLPTGPSLVLTGTLDAIESKVGQQVIASAAAGSISGFFDLKAAGQHLIGQDAGARAASRQADFWAATQSEAWRN